MMWMIIFAVVACALLIVAGYLFSEPDAEDPILIGVVLTFVALAILSVCSWRLYVKGVKMGYPTSLNNLLSDQIYEFFGQIQGSKEVVVLLENAEGRIRCVTVSELIDPNTEYVKTGSIEEETMVKRQKKLLVPVSKE